MLEKPDIDEKALVETLSTAYNVKARQIIFLPLGADTGTAVYKVEAEDGQGYFLKLRRRFDPVAVLVPQLLIEQGVKQVIPPMPTLDGALWTQFENFAVILSRYVDGRNGFQTGLTDPQRIEVGQALRRMHGAAIPESLNTQLRQEDFSPAWREEMRGFLAQVATQSYADPVAKRLANLLNDKRAVIEHVVNLAEGFAKHLKDAPQAFVLCHADIHAGNLLITDTGQLYIVDWDEVYLAPKERDLMFMGAWPDNVWRSVEDIDMFYKGYGDIEVNKIGLAYYRCERFVMDAVAYSRDLLLTDAGGADREAMYQQMAGQFLSGEVVDIVLATSAEAG